MQPIAGEPAASAPDAEPSFRAHLLDCLATLQTGIDGLGEWVAAESERAAARERVIDRQHEEIERLRAAQRAGQLRPTVTDLYRMRNDLLRQAATVPAEMTGGDVADLLRSYADTVEEALERCAVVILPRETGGAFVPGRQQVAVVVETNEPGLDGTVAAVVQDGYVETSGAVVAPTRIELYRYVTKETKDE